MILREILTGGVLTVNEIVKLKSGRKVNYYDEVLSEAGTRA